jgi:hypothetical protein
MNQKLGYDIELSIEKTIYLKHLPADDSANNANSIW